MEDARSLEGVVAPTATAFDDGGDLDEDGTRAQVEHVLEGGVHAVFPLGTTGEFPLLTTAERNRVIEIVVDAVDGSVPVLPGVGAPSTRRTIHHAQAAADRGADGCFVVTPYYYELDHDAAMAHYEAVASAVSIPIYAYQIPQRTGVRLAPRTVADLADRGTIAGIKDSSGDLARLREMIDHSSVLSVLIGADMLHRPGLEVGCDGMVSAVASVIPDHVVELFDAFEAGDTDRAREAEQPVVTLRRAIDATGHPIGAVKAALELQGISVGAPRAPLSTLEAGDVNPIRDALP